MLFLWFLNTYGPRLKDCRGDERRVIEPFRGRIKMARKSPGWRGGGNPEVFALKQFRFLIEPFRNEGLGDDRTIQG